MTNKKNLKLKFNKLPITGKKKVMLNILIKIMSQQSSIIVKLSYININIKKINPSESVYFSNRAKSYKMIN